MRRSRHTFRLPPELAERLADFASRRHVSRATVVEAALAEYLAPSELERKEAAFSRRLDRISKQLDKLDYHVDVGNEALALFVRAWLTANPALPPEQLAAAQAQAQQRFSAFIDAVARRIESGQRLA